METYISRHSIAEIRELVLHAKTPFTLISKAEISETVFEFHTKEIPAAVIRGTMTSLPEANDHKTKIRLSVDAVDDEKGASMLLYVFGYLVIATVFIIAVIKQPANVWVYVLTPVACVLLPLVMKVYNFFESSVPLSLAAKKEFLERIGAVKSS